MQYYGTQLVEKSIQKKIKYTKKYFIKIKWKKKEILIRALHEIFKKVLFLFYKSICDVFDEWVIVFFFFWYLYAELEGPVQTDWLKIVWNGGQFLVLTLSFKVRLHTFEA